MLCKSTRAPMFALLAAGALAAVPAIASAQAATAPQREGETHEVELKALPSEAKMANLEDLVGKTAIDFTLTDTEGKEHTLSDYLNDGKIVVLEWFNCDCPVVKRHYNGDTTMNDTVAKYEGKDVVWLAVATGNSADKDHNEKARENWNMDRPILLDESGDVGKAYGSKNTPTMYVINTDGVMAFGGGVDDNRRDDPTNYVEAAVDALLEGSTVTTSYARPYGCSVKYSRK